MNRVTEKRKLHDFWAFILFIVVSIGAYGVIIGMRHDAISLSAEKTILQRNFLVAGGVSLSAILLTLFFFTFLPVVFIHMSFVFSIIFPFVACFFMKSKLAIVLAVISGFISVFFYFICFKYIYFTAKVLKGATSVISSHIFSIIPVLLGIISFVGLQLYISFPLIIGLEKNESWLHILLFFQYCWTFFNSLYFFIVFSAGIVSIHLFNRGTKEGTFFFALKNTLFCIGSICLGGLLIAVVNTLRYIINTNESRNRERGNERGLLMTILIQVAIFLLYILEDIIHYANEWLYVYMAIYGKSYVNSLKESFQKAVDTRNMLLINNAMIDQVLSMLSFFFTLSFGLAAWFWNYRNFAKQKIGLDEFMGFIYPLFFCLFFLSCFFSLFSAGAKAVMFVYDEDNECVKEVLPEVHAGFVELRSKGY